MELLSAYEEVDDDSATTIPAPSLPPPSSSSSSVVPPKSEGSLIKTNFSSVSSQNVNLTPHVIALPGQHTHLQRPDEKVVYHNPSYDSLFAPVQGPTKVPGVTVEDEFTKNCWNGFVERDHIDEFAFHQQYHSFQNTGTAEDPALSASSRGTTLIQNDNPRVTSLLPGQEKGEEMGEKGKRKRKRKGEREDPAGDSFQGPWKPHPELEAYKVPEPTEEMVEKYKKKPEEKKEEEETEDVEEKTVFHGKELKDYLGRSFVDVPKELTSRIDMEHECYLPKKPIHTWSGHTKGVSAIQFFPKSGHLILSAGMDAKIKIWDVYNKRQCARTYLGHGGAVRSIDFSNDGKQFLSASYDRFVKLWDTETGQCINRFTNKKIPFCVKFYPVNNNEFLAACSNNKIIQWDTRTKEVVQEYDRHLMAVNTVLFVDEGRRFISTSDDKSIRIWEYGIPVDIKVIQEPHMHSMPSVAIHPKEKWFAAQSLDNQVLIYSANNRFSLNKKKRFTGHLTAGYACQVNFSPDCAYVISGSSGGQVYVWDWRTTRILKKLKAHDGVCIGCAWHPIEPSRIATCGWDGLIKYWD